MKPIFKLKDTNLTEPHQKWLGREVLDRYGRNLGRVKDILIEERSLDDAVREDQNLHAWTVKADFAMVRVDEDGLIPRFADRYVLIPIADIKEEGDLLRAVNEDRDRIRVTVDL